MPIKTKPPPSVGQKDADPVHRAGEHRSRDKTHDCTERRHLRKKAFVADPQDDERDEKHDDCPQRNVTKIQILRLKPETQNSIKKVQEFCHSITIFLPFVRLRSWT